MGRERGLLKEQLNDNVLWEYDLPAEKVKEVKGGYKVETDDGRMLVKVARSTPEALNLAREAVSYLISRGFRRVAPIRSTKYGDAYVEVDGHLYYLTDWISGKECQLEKFPQLQDAIATLAQMQAAAVGFIPPPSPGREKWHTWPERYQNRIGEIEECREVVERKDYGSDFDSLFITEAERFIEQGRFSLHLLDLADYQAQVEESRREGGICHRDFVGRNLIRNRKKEVFVVNFDNCQLDLRVFDLGRLMARVLPRYYWDIELAVNLLSIYEDISPLRPEELLILLSYLNFPQKLWRLARRYYLESAVLDNEVKILQELMLEQPVHQDFVRRFIRHYQLRH